MSQGVTDEQREHYARSVARAKAVLKPGDRVRLRICGGGQATYIFDHWGEGAGGWFVSRSGTDDLHPYNVTRVNGVATSFRDA